MDDTVRVGDFVKSYDFRGNYRHYMVGEVVEVMETLKCYKLRVVMLVSDNVVALEHPQYAYPPLNGSESLSGPTYFVERL